MTTREDMMRDHDPVPCTDCGMEVTSECIKFEKEAYYTGLILRDARQGVKVSQTELARRTQTTKSYISRIENGLIIPSVAVFYRMIAALGMGVEIVKAEPMGCQMSGTQTVSDEMFSAKCAKRNKVAK